MFLRKLLSYSAVGLVALQLSVHAQAAHTLQDKALQDKALQAKSLPPNPPLPELLDGTKQPKFVNKLVNVLDKDFIFQPIHTFHGVPLYKIYRTAFLADLGIVNKKGHHLHTPMFGFAAPHQKPTYPGRTFVVNSQKPIRVFWQNKLVNKHGEPLPEFRYVPVDETIHIAMPDYPTYPQSGLPAVVHLHGGFTEDLSDGNPDAWTTPNFAQTGPLFKKKVFRYDNAQESMMLWYHEHPLGFTRLTNYSGLNGIYIIRDQEEESLIKKHNLPTGKYEVPLMIADKMFTTKGDLFFPYYDPVNFPNEPQPSIQPEFLGDFMLVNGKAWPYLEVEPRKYRFRVLNACDSRFLDLHLTSPKSTHKVRFTQIATDQGFLNAPVKIAHILLGAAQRADLVIDFSDYKGQTLIMKNTANAPFPGGTPPNPHSIGLVMAFKVKHKADSDQPRTHLPKKLRKHSIKKLKPTTKSRKVLLFETMDTYGRVLTLLGTPKLGGLHWDDPITEKPRLGTTEIWEIYNTTGVSHPIHLHAGNFQILDRQYFSGTQDPTTGALSNIQLLGKPIPPLPAEHGLFDTVNVFPKNGGPVNALGQRTRIIMHFGLPGKYVWHCHILSHEDHDMMRPLQIVKK